MFWGCFGGSAVGDVVRIQGILKKGYKKILEDSAVPYGIHLIGPGCIFQQNNDPKPKSKLQGIFKRKRSTTGVETHNMVFTVPDLNLIELLSAQISWIDRCEN